MKFKELAWGAMVYRYSNKGTQGEYDYNNIIADKQYLQRLLVGPSLDDFEKIRNFLVHFGVHYAPKTLPEQYLNIWPKLSSHVYSVRNQELTTIDLSSSQTQTTIENAFDLLQYPYTWGGQTVASKVLHFFNIHLFMMWDDPIRAKYDSGGPHSYLKFIQEMQIQTKEAVADFMTLGLSGKPEEFLSQQLGHATIRPMTKFIDEYNWITITRGWPLAAPDWFLRLYGFE